MGEVSPEISKGRIPAHFQHEIQHRKHENKDISQKIVAEWLV